MTSVQFFFLSFISALLTAGQVTAQPFVLKGMVSSDDSLPLPFVSVSVLDLHTGTVTDSAGNFLIRIKRGVSIRFTAIGYADTTVFVGAATDMVVRLRRTPTLLRDLVVDNSSKGITIGSTPISPEQKLIGEMKGSMKNISDPGSDYNVVPQAIIQAGSIQMPGIGQASAGVNHGTTVLAFSDKEETRGSKYLLSHSCHGVVVDYQNHVMNDTLWLYNYNKLNGRLMLSRDGRQYMEVDPDKLRAFAFQDDDTCFIFMKVPIIDEEHFFSLVALGNQYGIYRSVRTAFVRSNFYNSGLIQRGNNYDEYSDQVDYYIVDYRNQKAGKFRLNRKSLILSLPSVRPRIERFLKEHTREDLNDAFLKELIEYLNQVPETGEMFALKNFRPAKFF